MDHSPWPSYEAEYAVHGIANALPSPFSTFSAGSFIGIKVISGRACEEEGIYSFSCGVGRNNVEPGKMGSDIKDRYKTYSSWRKKQTLGFEQWWLSDRHLNNSYIILYHSSFLKSCNFILHIYTNVFIIIYVLCMTAVTKSCVAKYKNKMRDVIM